MNAIVLPRTVLSAAGRSMEAAGVRGAEATGLLVAGSDRVVRRAVFPDQRAGRYPSCWVEVTDLGKRELATAIERDESYVSRIHSHPGAAFHSATDDRNPALQHEGAVSIVVPFFGLGARLGLGACAVFVRRRHHWEQLQLGSERDEVIRVCA